MRDLKRFLNPGSLAFIGGLECELSIKRTLEFGFSGKIFAVNPRRDEIAGIPALKSADDLPHGIDAAYVAVRNDRAVEVVRTLAAKGCGGVVVYSSGFAEVGNDDLQRQLVEAAGTMPLIGPNCYGYVNSAARAAMWPDESGLGPVDSGVALITQSGNIAVNFAMMMRNLPIATVISIGNQADVAMHDLIEGLTAEKRITAIGLHIEGLGDVAAFARAAALARQRRVPIVVLKTGRSEAGARATMSHTSSLAGADTLYDALFRRYGVARVDTPTQLAETLKFLHHGGALSGGRLVSMSCSGGEAALIADLAQSRSLLSFPAFTPEGKARVAATLNEYVTVDNPLDYHTFIWDDMERLTATFSAALTGGFDLGFVILDIPTHPRMVRDTWVTTAHAMAAAAKATGVRAAVIASMHEGMPQDVGAELSAAGVAPMIGLDDALVAFEAAAGIARNWASAEEPPEMLPPVTHGVDERVLGEHEAKALLNTYGLTVPEGIVCKAADAVAAAERLGYPVTIKVSSAAIAHKTEAGGVALNLKSADEVRAAAARMSALAPEVLVERMVTGAVTELIIGLTTDPQFGTALVIGAGGILTELLRDSASLILPTNRAEIEGALKSLKIWTLVEGFRGKSGDPAAVIAAVEAVAAFAMAHRGRVEELDVNPLLVLPDGAVAVDALIRMRGD